MRERKLAIGLVVALAFLGLIGLRGGDLWQRRAQILSAGDRRAENMALILAGYVQQTFGTADAALRQLVLHNTRVRGPMAPAAEWVPALAAATGGLQAIGSISVVDTAGIIRHSSQPMIVGQSRREQFVFSRLAADTADVMIADTPFRTVVGDRQFVVPLGRRLVSARGTFDGIVVASFIPDSLREFFRTVDVGSDGAVAVFHRGGVVLLREPSTRNPLGDEATGHPLFEAAQRLGGVGVHRGRVQPDAPVLRTAFRSLPEQRLIVAVSLGERELLTEWRRNAVASLVVALVAVAILGGFLLFLFHQMDVRERVEQALARSQRLESLGQLTGGVAHDFNNLLTVILGNVSLLKTAPTSSGSAIAGDESLVEIERAAGRAADLTRQLLAFARRQPLLPRVVDLSAIVEGASSMLRRVVGEPVKLRIVAAKEPCLANIDPVQGETALLNLCINARDAMPGGGALVIETGLATLDGHYAREAPDVTPGRYSLVTVSDNGVGIRAEHLPRLFEPFFTTKGPGRGTGLGLSMVYGFVKQSGGHIRVYSEVGRGTTVKVYFPQAPGPATEVASSRDVVEHRGNGEVVLLVEDDPLVRKLATRLLRRLGYTVVDANDGESALSLASGAAKVDLLLTDVMLPGDLSGPRLATELTRLRPGLPVLFASGYSQEIVELGAHAGASLRFLSKPYDRRQLAQAVHDAIRGRQ